MTSFHRWDPCGGLVSWTWPPRGGLVQYICSIFWFIENFRNIAWHHMLYTVHLHKISWYLMHLLGMHSLPKQVRGIAVAAHINWRWQYQIIKQMYQTTSWGSGSRDYVGMCSFLFGRSLTVCPIAGGCTLQRHATMVGRHGACQSSSSQEYTSHRWMPWGGSKKWGNWIEQEMWTIWRR